MSTEPNTKVIVLCHTRKGDLEVLTVETDLDAAAVAEGEHRAMGLANATINNYVDPMVALAEDDPMTRRLHDALAWQTRGPEPSVEAIVFVTNHDDWEGLYVHGRLVLEGHTLQRRDYLRHLQGCTGTIAEYYVDPEWTQERGNLPTHLVEIPDDQIIERTPYA